MHVATVKTAEAAWNIIQDMFAAKSRANTVNTRIALANAEKGNKTMGEYIAHLKTLENDMISAGKPLDAEDRRASPWHSKRSWNRPKKKWISTRLWAPIRRAFWRSVTDQSGSWIGRAHV